jgi:hypothetical protein
MKVELIDELLKSLFDTANTDTEGTYCIMTPKFVNTFQARQIVEKWMLANRLDVLVMRKGTDIYNMELHQTIKIEAPQKTDGYLPYRYATRVPGGWIYSDYDSEKDTYIEKIFIPFDNDMYKQEMAF